MTAPIRFKDNIKVEFKNGKCIRTASTSQTRLKNFRKLN